MRDLTKVMIDKVIPADQSELIAGLKATQSSIMYTSPETHEYRWREVAALLNAKLGDPSLDDKSEWQKRLADVFAGRGKP